jgi:hypothetical protein
VPAASAAGGVASNADVASRLDEVAEVLAGQDANPYRVRAYRRAAETVRALDRSVTELIRSGGDHALEDLPGVGPSLARTIHQLAIGGHLPLLERLRGESDPLSLLASVPGIGKRTAERVHEELAIHSLEELESAAHDGRLATVIGGAKRLAGIRDALAGRLGRVRRIAAAPASEQPTVAEILDVDREYREAAAAGGLKRIAPRRFNPAHEAWLPILHAIRGPRHYTVLFSNTARAHELGKTADWVVLFFDGPGGERQCTVITAERGAMTGRRIVRGREDECARFHAGL